MNNFWKSRSKRHSRQKQTLEAKDLNWMEYCTGWVITKGTHRSLGSGIWVSTGNGDWSQISQNLNAWQGKLVLEWEQKVVSLVTW